MSNRMEPIGRLKELARRLKTEIHALYLAYRGISGLAAVVFVVWLSLASLEVFLVARATG